MDDDGDVDVLSALRNGINWYENIDGRGTFGVPQVITTDGAVSVVAADVDGDGDFNSYGVIDFADFLILANNFGRSRELVAPKYFPLGSA